MSHILILADHENEKDQAFDTKCLATLMAISDIFRTPGIINGLDKIDEKLIQRRGIASLDLAEVARKGKLEIERDQSLEASCVQPHIICEILDHNTLLLLESKPDLFYRFEWCVSNNIIAKVLAMIGEQRELARIIEDLLDEHGQDIQIRDASQFVGVDEECNFYSIMQRAHQQGELAIGYFKFDIRYEDKVDAVLNPRDKTTPMKWNAEKDNIITLAEYTAAPNSRRNYS